MKAKAGWIGGALALLLFAFALVMLVRNWPFTQTAVEREVGQALSAHVVIRAFHSRWFPHPGFDAGDVQITTKRGPISINHVVVESSYTAFVRQSRDLTLVRLEGAAARLTQGPFDWAGNVDVDELLLDGSSLEMEPSTSGGNPLKIGIPHADVRDISPSHPVRFEVLFDWSKPRGRLAVKGQYGPRPAGNPMATPVSGHFHFEKADLSAIQNLEGLLTVEGKFAGPISGIKVEGDSHVANLKIADRAHHTFQLTAKFAATVDGSNADVHLDTVESSFLGTSIHWSGDVAGQGSGGKEARLQMTSEKARTQDLLYVVSQAPRAAMNGPIGFRGQVILPPDDGRFLERLRMDGDFGIDGARFGKPSTQSNIATLSERARGEKKPEDDPESIVSDVQGHVSLRRGVAVLSNLTFRVPGASAKMHGTFNVISYAVDLHGELALEKELSDTTTGFKSVLLKALDPVFKRKRAGAVIPVSITGTYQSPVFSTLGMHTGLAAAAK